jgi:hypothetical protein
MCSDYFICLPARMDESRREKVIKTVRDAIVAAAKDAEIVKEKTSNFAKRAEATWQQTKPLQRKAQENVRRVAQDVVDFGKSVAQGVTEGVKEVRERSTEE